MSTKMKMLKVPRKPVSPRTGKLQVQGVKLENIKFVREQTYELGYSSYGEYMNALLDILREDGAGSQVQKKGRRQAKRAS